MKQFYRLAALFLALLLLCGCAAGNGYGKPERKEGQDQYLTDPVPEGKPQPVEPQAVTVSDTEYTCTISISCASIPEHMDLCDKEKGGAGTEGRLAAKARGGHLQAGAACF